MDPSSDLLDDRDLTEDEVTSGTEENMLDELFGSEDEETVEVKPHKKAQSSKVQMESDDDMSDVLHNDGEFKPDQHDIKPIIVPEVFVAPRRGNTNQNVHLYQRLFHNI